MIELFYQDEDAFFQNVMLEATAKNVDYRILMLDYFYDLKNIAKKQYNRLGIDDTIFMDTMTDLEIWRNNCKKSNGVDGLQEYKWLKKHMKLKLFKLGRLQFEPICFEKSMFINENKINAGDIVLSVHVQQGDKLDYMECKKSYEQAYCFFRGVTNIFFCHSWLLFPALRTILSKNSNILMFSNDYSVFNTDNNDTQAEERIFGKVEQDKSLYKEETTLMRNAKKHLQANNYLGCSSGVYFYKNMF